MSTLLIVLLVLFLLGGGGGDIPVGVGSASAVIDLHGSQPVEHRADPKRSPSETLAARAGVHFVFSRCPYNTGRPSPSGLGLAVM